MADPKAAPHADGRMVQRWIDSTTFVVGVSGACRNARPARR